MVEDKITEILAKELFGNTYREYAIALIIFLSVFVITQILKLILQLKVRTLVKKTLTDFDDLLLKVAETINWPVASIIAFNFAISSLEVSSRASNAVRLVSIVLLSFYVIRLINSIIYYFADKLIHRLDEEERSADASVVKIGKNIIGVVIWFIGLIVILENVGYDVSALVAGVGVSSIAIAFALQNILSDLFASISIFFDRPFTVGDFIKVNDDMGTVQKIGVKSSRIKTLEGEELVIPNQLLASTRVRNYKHLRKRRVAFTVGVTYETSNTKLKKIPDIVQKIVESKENTVYDRTHFKSYGDSALIFEIVYFVLEKDYNKFMDTLASINMDIKEKFEKEKIDFAYPTQTVYNHGSIA